MVGFGAEQSRQASLGAVQIFAFFGDLHGSSVKKEHNLLHPFFHTFFECMHVRPVFFSCIPVISFCFKEQTKAGTHNLCPLSSAVCWP
jgi:hypothetical protein